MKILVICQHYWPEPYPLADVCEELVRRGHTVHVVTGVPNYPMGVIYPEYTKGRGREQVHNGVRITRTFTIGRRQNLLLEGPGESYSTLLVHPDSSRILFFFFKSSLNL